MKKKVKGSFGYIKYRRYRTAVTTILFFGISLALFAAGYISTGKKENLLTIVAVLGCLPASKSLVNLIMLFRAKGCSEEARAAIAPLEGRLNGMYDMYFTSYQKNFALSHMMIVGNVILGYTEDEKCDIKACVEHLQTMLKQGGVKDMTITVSNQLQKYCEQLWNLNEMEENRKIEKEEEVRGILGDITL
ncbi:MAG: hypothetical protein NC400_01375 [Clostridium sp.]|nr:hypothetical protein [Clostridium sp.]